MVPTRSRKACRVAQEEIAAGKVAYVRTEDVPVVSPRSTLRKFRSSPRSRTSQACPMPQSESARRVGWGRRLSYAFIGLVAGNAAMDAYLLTGYVRTFILSPAPSQSNWRHFDRHVLVVSSVRNFLADRVADRGPSVCFPPSFASCPPLTLGCDFAHLRCAWPGRFLPIMLLLFRNQGFRHTGTLWLLSVIASVVGFSTYAWLVRAVDFALSPRESSALSVFSVVNPQRKLSS